MTRAEERTQKEVLAAIQAITPATGGATAALQTTGNAYLSSIDNSLTNLQVAIAGGTTATVTQVVSSATSITLLALNTSRIGAFVYNDSSAILLLKFGTTASTTSFSVRIAAGGFYEFLFPVYDGRIDAIWTAANGFAYVTEVS